MAETDNATLAAGLREVADWLDAHPELPQHYYAAISFRSMFAKDNAREVLTRVADALGDRAVENVNGTEVSIEAHIGGVRVSAQAKIADLRDEPPVEPEYEPILRARASQ